MSGRIFKNIGIWLAKYCDLLIPVIVFLLLAYGRTNISYLSRINVDITKSDKEEINYTTVPFNLNETQIYYAPNTPVYEEYMHLLKEKFSIVNNPYGFPNETSMWRFLEDAGKAKFSIGITFHSKDEKNLNYTLSLYHKGLHWETGNLYNNPSSFKPGIGTPYIHGGYVQLQLAIGTIYIENKSGQKLEDIIVELLKFPYPPYQDDKGLNLIFFYLLPIVTLATFMSSFYVKIKASDGKLPHNQELVNVTTIQSPIIWLKWFYKNVLSTLASVFLIVCILTIPFLGSTIPFIRYTSPTIIFVFLMLYGLKACTWILFSTTVTSKYRWICWVYWTIHCIVPYYIVLNNGVFSKWSGILMMLLLCNIDVYFGYSIIGRFEETGVDLQWSNFQTSPYDESNTLTMAIIFFMLILNSILYYLLYAVLTYKDSINPRYQTSTVRELENEPKESSENIEMTTVEERKNLLIKSEGNKITVSNTSHVNQVVAITITFLRGEVNTLTGMITGYIKTLISRHYILTGHKLMDYLCSISRTIVLLIVCTVCSKTCNFLNTFVNEATNTTDPLKLDLATYGNTTVFFYYTQLPNLYMSKLPELCTKLVQSSGSVPLNISDVSEVILPLSNQYPPQTIMSTIFAQRGTKLEITGLYNSIAKHSAPISLNFIINILAKLLLGEEYSISTTNHPLKDTDAIDNKMLLETQTGVLWLTILLPTLLDFLGTFRYILLSDTCSEITKDFILEQSPFFYRICMLIFDYFLYIVFTVIIVGISMLLTPFWEVMKFDTMMKIVLLSGLSNIPYAYLFSRKKSLGSSNSAFIISGLICGIISTLIVKAFKYSEDDWYVTVGQYLETFCYLFVPPFVLPYLSMEYSNLAVQQYNYKNLDDTQKMAYCNTNMDHPCCVEVQQCLSTYDNFLEPITCCLVFLSAVILILINILIPTIERT